MSEEDKATTQISEKLINEEQQNVLQNIARLGQGLANQRALALLALDDGSTRAEAGEQSGLSLGQIKYLQATFRLKGLAMFSQDVYGVVQPGAEKIDPEVGPKEEVKAEKDTKIKKVKKGKKKRRKKDKPKGKEAKMAKEEKDELEEEKKDEKVKAKGKKGKKDKKDKKGKKGKKGKGGKKKGKK